MNKTAIKNFSIWARNKLMTDVAYQMHLLGIDEKEIKTRTADSTADIEFYDIGTREPYQISGCAVRQRQALVDKLRALTEEENHAIAYQTVLEEVAYTWFNRLIALRFMEVNDYLPGKVRVLSSGSLNKVEPEIVTTPFDGELEYTDAERDQILAWQENNKTDELFQLLFHKTCNQMHAYLPELFECTKDYTELLLNLSVTDPGGVVYHLVHDIPEDDFNVDAGGQVEIIGWLYQYYNTEPKDKVFANLKKNIKITKHTIPAATQLFTPDWIVRYMVENSLGRKYVNSQLPKGLSEADRQAKEKAIADEMGWKYYLPEAEQTPEVRAQLDASTDTNTDIESWTFLDPCMGSGHVLVYVFEVFMQIYVAQGYSERDAVECILTKNLYGLDIDDRAGQLAYFAVMMKARAYSRRIFSRGIRPQVYAIQESNGLERWRDLNRNNGFEMELEDTHFAQLDSLLDLFHDAKEYGSILNVPEGNYSELLGWFNELRESGLDQNLMAGYWITKVGEKLPALTAQAEVMAQKYDVVVTNPPYMGRSGMGVKISTFVKQKYPMGKSDLFTCFIEKGLNTLKKNGFNCMVTMQSWMFLNSFENLRIQILKKYDIVNLMHMDNMVMNIAFGTVVTNFLNNKIKLYKGTYNQVKFVDLYNDIPREFPIQQNRFNQVSTDRFANIAGMPVAYWISDNVYDIICNNSPLISYVDICQGMKTADNNQYLRLWNEVDVNNINYTCSNAEEAVKSNAKWFAYNKGGDFRKWYGNREYVINWYNDGEEVKAFPNAVIRNESYFFREALTWSLISSGNFGIRYSPKGSIFDGNGSSIFEKEDKNIIYYLAFLSSKITQVFLHIFSPTMTFEIGQLSKLPVVKENVSEIGKIGKENIKISNTNWDSFEISWDFKHSPLLIDGGHSNVFLHFLYEHYRDQTNADFDKLKANEEELNRIFINIYGLQDELTPEESLKDVTVHRIYDTKAEIPEEMRTSNYALTKQDVIKQFISYGVGCLFGRYSLDTPGLAYAGGAWDSTKYSTFTPDADNVIPILDDNYTQDDIVDLFVSWLKAALGAEHLEENLTFIAEALENKGVSARDTLRQYFLKNFYKDHCKMYQKRPIYWLYDSGKQNGFKALIYLHRYNEDTTGRVRMDYLRKIEQIYFSEIDRMEQDMADTALNAREVAKARTRRDKLQKQLKECQEYDEQISQPALARIALDLDDGVKVNYGKAQTVNGKTYKVLAKI